MYQFIIENPVLCIVIAFIIGVVSMNATLLLAVRMTVDKEVAKALGGEKNERFHIPAPPAPSEQEPKIKDRSERLIVMLGVDGDGCRCIYLDLPLLYKKGEGPLAEMGHDYYFHPTLQIVADDFDLDKLAELGIDIRPEVKFNPMDIKFFRLENEKVTKFLEEAFTACAKAIADEE